MQELGQRTEQLPVGALSDFGTAMLYSLSAITSYGHVEVLLAPRWRLMGAIEDLNGIMLFGLTTAFFFNVFQTVGRSRVADGLGYDARDSGTDCFGGHTES
jgi:hypothetical protein